MMLIAGWEAILFLFRFPKSWLFSENDLSEKGKRKKLRKLSFFAEMPLANMLPRQQNSDPSDAKSSLQNTRRSFLPRRRTLCCQSGSYRLNKVCSPFGRE